MGRRRTLPGLLPCIFLYHNPYPRLATILAIATSSRTPHSWASCVTGGRGSAGLRNPIRVGAPIRGSSNYRMCPRSAKRRNLREEFRALFTPRADPLRCPEGEHNSSRRNKRIEEHFQKEALRVLAAVVYRSETLT